MKKFFLFISLYLFISCGVLAQKKKDKLEKKNKVENVQQSAIKRRCPDPAVVKIHFKILSRSSKSKAVVRIEGIVKNVGKRNFTSGPTQQAVLIYEQYPGGKQKLVKRRPFQNLAAGRTIKVQYDRKWDSNSPGLAEFPPTFEVRLSYDPDIESDDNPRNDDCNKKNNSRERSGGDFNEMLNTPYAPDGRYELKFKVRGEARRAIIHSSNDKSKPAPALIYFHGRTGWAEDSEARRRFETLWPEAYIVYAEGTNFDDRRDSTGNIDPDARGWQIRFPHVHTYCHLSKDYDYLLNIRGHLTQTERVDPDRIFACGHSSGGFFTLSLMEIDPVFRAYAALGCYSQYKARLESSICDDVYNYRPQELVEGEDIATNPAPVLYMFGDGDTVFGNGFDSDCNNDSKCKTTIRELTIRNNAHTPACSRFNSYMNNYLRQHYPPKDPSGEEVQFQIYNGTHSWPAAANQWVVDYFKSF